MVVQFIRYDATTGKCIPVGNVDDSPYFRFGRSFAGLGTWDLRLPITSANAKRVRGANMIKVGSRRAGIITGRQIEDTDDYYGITFSGTELKGLAAKRIVMPPTGSAYQSHHNQTAEYVIEQLLRQQITEAADTKRRILGTIGAYSAGSNLITYDGRFGALVDDITAITEAYSIGWYAEIVDRAIVWHIYHGVDRRVSSTTAGTLLLAGSRDNIGNRVLAEMRNVPNTAITAGQGEGVDRVISIVGDSNAGLDRNEIFVDARDVSDTSELTTRGDETLAQQSDTAVYSFTLQTSAVKDYFNGVFDLGDQCTVRDTEFLPGEDIEGRFAEAEEVFNEGILMVNATIGYDKRNLAAAIARIRKSTNSLLMT